MLKERIKEIFEFFKSESPYRKANKGWISQDVFLDLRPSVDTTKQTSEAAKVTLFWSPINSLLSNIFLIIILGSILVFTSLSFSKGRFDFNLFNKSAIIDNIKLDEKKDLNINKLNDIDSTNSTSPKNIKTKDLDKKNIINSLDDDLIKADQEIINQKIYEKDSSIKESLSNKDNQILQIKKSKSNFI